VHVGLLALSAVIAFVPGASSTVSLKAPSQLTSGTAIETTAGASADLGTPQGVEVSPSDTCQASSPNPYACRPTCDSLFLQSEWSLTFKQKACDLVQNHIFSSSGLAAAAFSAATQPIWDGIFNQTTQPSGFGGRFATNFAQSAFKSTGAFVGGLVFHEDPRDSPPYLVLREKRSHGGARRTLDALGANFIAYRCDGKCATKDDIRRVPALSRIAGSFASGFSIYALSSDRSNLQERALRGTASAYGATFANSVFSEFSPELSALIGRVSRALGVR
jgi:hypothetical protein